MCSRSLADEGGESALAEYSLSLSLSLSLCVFISTFRASPRDGSVAATDTATYDQRSVNGERLSAELRRQRQRPAAVEPDSAGTQQKSSRSAVPRLR